MQGEACLAAHDVISSCLSAVCDGNGLLEAKGTEPRILIQALPYYVQRCLQVNRVIRGMISCTVDRFSALHNLSLCCRSPGCRMARSQGFYVTFRDL